MRRPGASDPLADGSFAGNSVFHGLAPSLDPALGLRAMRCASDMIHALVLEELGQIGRDVRRAAISERPGLVHDCDLIAA